MTSTQQHTVLKSLSTVVLEFSVEPFSFIYIFFFGMKGKSVVGDAKNNSSKKAPEQAKFKDIAVA